jgi:DNA-binding response OmpR family regulator
MASSNQATILVVDDDPSMRELLNLHLTNAGYDVRLAEDAIVAGHLLVKQLPDLVLLDIDIPHMDGFQFMEVLKADQTVRHIPVLFLTANEEGKERGHKLGAAGYLTKPVLASQLLLEVARHIPGAPQPIG